MNDFIIHIAVCELVLIGIFASTRRGMILGFIPRIINHYFIEKYRIELRCLKRERAECVQKIKNLKEGGNSQEEEHRHLQIQPLDRQTAELKTPITLAKVEYLALNSMECILRKKVNFREKLLYPIYYCLPCMSSFWGTIYFLIFIGGSFSQWTIFLLALCGLGWLLRNHV